MKTDLTNKKKTSLIKEESDEWLKLLEFVESLPPAHEEAAWVHMKRINPLTS
jgi:hypothetical protein